MAGVETTITSVLDIFPWFKMSKRRRYGIITAICVAYFIAGITYTVQSGTYWVELIDTYSGNWAVLIVGALECISISWFYGFANFRKDISLMIGKKYTDSKLFYLWNVCWAVVTPGLLIVLVVLAFRDLKPISLKNYTMPFWTHVLGELITASTLSGFIFWALYLIYDAKFVSKKVSSAFSILFIDYNRG
jgi:hypothetical protein